MHIQDVLPSHFVCQSLMPRSEIKYQAFLPCAICGESDSSPRLTFKWNANVSLFREAKLTKSTLRRPRSQQHHRNVDSISMKIKIINKHEIDVDINRSTEEWRIVYNPKILQNSSVFCFTIYFPFIHLIQLKTVYSPVLGIDWLQFANAVFIQCSLCAEWKKNINVYRGVILLSFSCCCVRAHVFWFYVWTRFEKSTLAVANSPHSSYILRRVFLFLIHK